VVWGRQQESCCGADRSQYLCLRAVARVVPERETAPIHVAPLCQFVRRGGVRETFPHVADVGVQSYHVSTLWHQHVHVVGVRAAHSGAEQQPLERVVQPSGGKLEVRWVCQGELLQLQSRAATAVD
jgi:hypothetical protein